MEDDILLEQVFTAYFDARKKKRNKKSQLAFELELESNLMRLYEQIKDRTYTPGKAKCFLVFHPVKREIFASLFVDRVVQHLLYNYLAPVFERIFIEDSYSCRKGRGTLFGIERLQHHIRSCTDNFRRQAWVLKLDVRGYFMSINREILYRLVMKTLNNYWERAGPQKQSIDKDTVLFLLRTIIFRNPAANCEVCGNRSEWDDLPPSKSLLKSPPGVGLPIGDLTSQLFSNIYLHQLDVYMKCTMRCRHYGRYVDDFYVVHRSKTFLKQLIPKVCTFLRKELGLTVHPNKVFLQDVRQGISFLGAFIKPYRRYAAIRGVKYFRERMYRIGREARAMPFSKERRLEVRATVNSYLGYLGKFKSRKIVDRVMGKYEYVFDMFE